MIIMVYSRVPAPIALHFGARHAHPPATIGITRAPALCPWPRMAPLEPLSNFPAAEISESSDDISRLSP